MVSNLRRQDSRSRRQISGLGTQVQLPDATCWRFARSEASGRAEIAGPGLQVSALRRWFLKARGWPSIPGARFQASGARFQATGARFTPQAPDFKHSTPAFMPSGRFRGPGAPVLSTRQVSSPRRKILRQVSGFRRQVCFDVLCCSVLCCVLLWFVLLCCSVMCCAPQRLMRPDTKRSTSCAARSALFQVRSAQCAALVGRAQAAL